MKNAPTLRHHILHISSHPDFSRTTTKEGAKNNAISVLYLFPISLDLIINIGVWEKGLEYKALQLGLYRVQKAYSISINETIITLYITKDPSKIFINMFEWIFKNVIFNVIDPVLSYFVSRALWFGIIMALSWVSSLELPWFWLAFVQSLFPIRPWRCLLSLGHVRKKILGGGGRYFFRQNFWNSCIVHTFSLYLTYKSNWHQKMIGICLSLNCMNSK